MAGPPGHIDNAAASPEQASPGRDDLVAELVDAARQAVGGEGSLVLLTGDAGIGKTSVARAVTREVGDSMEVYWGHCSADESAPPFWPWRGLLDVDGALPGTDTAVDPAIGAARFDHLEQLRRQLADRRDPMLVVLEDIHWADVASVLLLTHLSTAIDQLPLMVLATLRTSDPLGLQLRDAIDELRRVASVHSVPPLGDAAVDALIRDAGLESDPDLTTLLRARTGGNPLFVTELLRAARTTSSAAALRRVISGSVPERVAELIAQRLERLPAAVAEVVATASVVGMQGDVRALAAIGGSDVESVVDLLEQARAARLLDSASPGRWQFRHDLIRDAVYAGLGDRERASKHAAVLEGLATAGSPPPSVLARHALAALPLFDPERAVALAARAGEEAFAQHAYEEAVAWFDQALDAAPDDIGARWTMELLVLRGEAHRHLGALQQARQSFLDAATHADRAGDPSLLARAALGYADPGADLGIAFRSDDPVTAALLERAIGAQPDPASVSSVLLETRLAAELYFSDQPGRTRRLIDAALDSARHLDADLAVAAASAVFHDAFVVGQADLNDQLAGSEQLLVSARATGSAGALLAAHRARVIDLLSAGDMSRMDAETVAFRRVAEPLRVPAYLWWPALWSAMRALLEGRHALAEERAVEAFALGETAFVSLAFVNLSFLLFFLRREQGRLAEMEQATREFASSHADIPAIRVGLTFLLAELGRAEEARGLLAAVIADDLGRLHDRNWPASWFQLARAAFLVDDERTAAELLNPGCVPTERCVMVSLATVCLGSTDLPRAWLHETLGELDAADRHYRDAEERNARIGARSWLAQALADHAGLLLTRCREGDEDQARRLIERTAELAADIGLPAVLSQIDELQERLSRAVSPSAAGPHACTFHRSGDVWEVEFAGRSARLPHARGLTDLAFLLSRPDQAVSVLELSGDNPTVASAAPGALALDERARREIRDRLRELDAEVAEAEENHDDERAAMWRERRQQLAEAVARDLGLGGRSRRVDDSLERARKTVSTRILRTIATLARAHPELGRHLERCVDTGAWCAYRPSEPISWRL
jgi:tetratricopeptide (TPR) repeat protein